MSTQEMTIGQRASSRAHSQDSNQSFSSVQSQVTHVHHTFMQVMLPVNPATGTNVPPGYHPDQSYANTRLPQNQLGIMLDTGAWTNIAGTNVARQLAAAASKAKLEVKQTKMSKPLQVAGIGNGIHVCNYEASIQICAQEADETSPGIHRYEVPILDSASSAEPAAQIPAILGLKSMEAMKAVIETRPEGPCLTVPGPGGYEITWAPGARRFNLQKAPSGHLVIPMQEFSRVQQAAKTGTSISQQHVVFHAANPETPSVNQQTGSWSENESSRNIDDPSN